MPLTGEYEPGTSAWSRKQVELYEATNGEEGSDLRGMPVIVLTSVGAKTGKLRKTALMRVERGGVYAVVASLGGAPKNPVWYYNLKKNPTSSCRIERPNATTPRARSRVTRRPSGGSARSRPGPTTRITRRRLSARSRCSCSNRWSRGRFLPSPRAAPPRPRSNRGCLVREPRRCERQVVRQQGIVIRRADPVGLPLDRIDERPILQLVRRVENGRRRKRGLLRASPHEEPVVEYLQRQGHSVGDCLEFDPVRRGK